MRPNKKGEPQIELERRLLHGLHLEWESAKRGNPNPLIRTLTPPIFALNEARSTLAHWNGKRREISFSRHFISHHPWDAIREVLLHEMAHQVAQEIFHAHHETSHGPAFQRACDTLGANPKASGSYPALKDRLLAGPHTSGDPITQRIHKLFALAQSNNPHESEAALAKARLLMEKHRIQTLESEATDAYSTIFLGRPRLRHHREYYALANLLTEHYFVRCIWAMAYVVESDKMGRVLEVSGATAHVLAAEYIYHFILDTIDRSWAGIQQGRGQKLNRYRKSDYADGLLEGFSQKLRKEKDTCPEALLPKVIHDPDLDVYMGRRYPRVIRRSRRINSADATLINQGMEAGKRMHINPGVDIKKGPCRALTE